MSVCLPDSTHGKDDCKWGDGGTVTMQFTPNLLWQVRLLSGDVRAERGLSWLHVFLQILIPCSFFSAAEAADPDWSGPETQSSCRRRFRASLMCSRRCRDGRAHQLRGRHPTPPASARVIFRTTISGLLTSLIVFFFLILYIRAAEAGRWGRFFGWRWGRLQLLISIRLQQVLPLINPAPPQLVIIREIIWLVWK